MAVLSVDEILCMLMFISFAKCTTDGSCSTIILEKEEPILEGDTLNLTCVLPENNYTVNPYYLIKKTLRNMLLCGYISMIK